MMVSLLFVLFSLFQSFKTESFWVSFEMKKVEGSLYIAVYDDAAVFLKPNKQVFATIVPVYEVLQEVKIDLPPGNYAISVFQDIDGNGKISAGFFGIPQEPYGFSNNARGFTGPPDFEDCLFDSEKINKLVITLK